MKLLLVLNGTFILFKDKTGYDNKGVFSAGGEWINLTYDVFEL